MYKNVYNVRIYFELQPFHSSANYLFIIFIIRQIWGFASENPEFNKLFNPGMGCTAKIAIEAVVAVYKDGFGCIWTLVDVGGVTGGAVAELVKAYPHLKGIDFDLPHVVALAPAYEGVSHVGGDMFKSIPKADAIFMKIHKIKASNLIIFSQIGFMCLVYHMDSGYCTIGTTKIASRS